MKKPEKSTKCWCYSNAYSSSSWNEFETSQQFSCCCWDMYLPPTQTSLPSISNTHSEWPATREAQHSKSFKKTILTPSSDGWCIDLVQTLGEQSTFDPHDRRCWQPRTCSSSWTILDRSAMIAESCTVRQTLAIFCTWDGNSGKSFLLLLNFFQYVVIYGYPTWYSSLYTETTPGKFLYFIATLWLDSLQWSPDSKLIKARFHPRRYAILVTEIYILIQVQCCISKFCILQQKYFTTIPWYWLFR